MATIDMNSILAKAKKATNSSAFQKKLETKVDTMLLGGGVIASGRNVTIYGTSMAAAKFIEVLQAEIQSHAGLSASSGGLGSTAIDALIKLEHGAPVKVGRNRYQIEVRFTEDLRRDSLDPSVFDGIDNIAALLNNGYSAAKTVYGIWLGHSPWNIPSLQHRDGAHFIENAIRNFMANYAHEYGVIDIEVDDVYK